MRFSEIKKQLSRFSVGIAGAGGLGSNCAVALARTGIGRLVIADYDIVEAGNLNRQYFFTRQVGMKKTEALKENLRDINPDTLVEIHSIKLKEDNIPAIFSDCDIIVEAFDRGEMKKMLAETVISTWPERPLIIGSGLAGYGDNNKLRERRIGSTLIICGDEETEVSEELPPLAPRVAIIANMQANVVIELLLKRNNA
ncbi:MAG: sulfur carrier protein ThiS adenylyltransferase ThiF [Bacteroidales bacterium]|nr:sulfur carrier protein ThiS adenylyltransferase ThiF [Bacteroidales bacterium]